MIYCSFRKVLLGFLLCAATTAWAGEAYYIDVRTADEYKAGHVSSASNIPYDVIGERISEITDDLDAQIFVYCRSGNRSGKALKTLESLGFTNVQNLGSLEDARTHASANADSSLIFD